MAYIVSVFIIISGYYTLTYGITIYLKDKNKLGGFATMALALISTILPILMIFMKRR
jgi:hypothetical protein